LAGCFLFILRYSFYLSEFYLLEAVDILQIVPKGKIPKSSISAVFFKGIIYRPHQKKSLKSKNRASIFRNVEISTFAVNDYMKYAKTGPKLPEIGLINIRHIRKTEDRSVNERKDTR